MKKNHQQFIIGKEDQGQTLIDFLALKTAISKEKLKQVLNFGGVWLSCSQFPNRPRKRVRRAKKELLEYDLIDFYFDETIFQSMKEYSQSIGSNINGAQGVRILKEDRSFSCWYKPEFILSQGTDYGDEGAMIRIVEKAKGESYLIHRLDREVAGIMVFAHDGKTAAILSEVFQKREVEKLYIALVEKKFQDQDFNQDFKIDYALDGKKAETIYRPIFKDDHGTYLLINLLTGRKHQIRRHLQMAEMPIVGDIRYQHSSQLREGKEGKMGEKTLLKLWAVVLSFPHPWKKNQKVTVKVPLPFDHGNKISY